MAIYDPHNETHDKYVQCLKIMHEKHKTAEYAKKPDTPEETEFMKQSNKAIYANTYAMNMSEAEYQRIFQAESRENAGEFLV